MHPIELLGDMSDMESHFFSLEIVLLSVQDWYVVCTKRTIGSEIVLDAPDGTLGDEPQLKARSVWR
jgi:hypothetical protein